MVVGDFHIGRLSRFPAEGNPPLHINREGPHAGKFSFHGVEAVAWRAEELGDVGDGVELDQEDVSAALDISRELLGEVAIENPLGFFAGEALDHGEKLANLINPASRILSFLINRQRTRWDRMAQGIGFPLFHAGH